MNDRATQFNGEAVLVSGHSDLSLILGQAAARAGARVCITAAQSARFDCQETIPSRLCEEKIQLFPISSSWVRTEEEVEGSYQPILEVLSPLQILFSTDLCMSREDSTMIADTSLEQWQNRTIAPLRHLFLLCQRAIQEFLGSGQPGRIVIVSRCSERSFDNGVIKPSLVAFVRSITKEYGSRGIACNALELPTHKLAGPNECSDLINLALFLASSEASYVNGEYISAR